MAEGLRSRSDSPESVIGIGRKTKLAVDLPLPAPWTSLDVDERDDSDSFGCRDEVGGVRKAAQESPAGVMVERWKTFRIPPNL